MVRACLGCVDICNTFALILPWLSYSLTTLTVPGQGNGTTTLRKELKAASSAVGSFLISMINAEIGDERNSIEWISTTNDKYQFISTFATMMPFSGWFSGLSSYHYSNLYEFTSHTLPMDGGLISFVPSCDRNNFHCSSHYNISGDDPSGIVKSLADPTVPGYDLFHYLNETSPVSKWYCYTEHDTSTTLARYDHSSGNTGMTLPLTWIPLVLLSLLMWAAN
jgi:hypothetical protein